MLPRLFVIPWWLVFLGLGVTAVLSVPPTEGEEPYQEHQISQDNQELGNFKTEETVGQETTLIQQLQARLSEVEEREQRLQKKQERLEGLQRDLEQLASSSNLRSPALIGEGSCLRGRTTSVSGGRSFTDAFDQSV